MRNRRTGFTLIELLIVVAIIAILAAIAVPNFLEAQSRAKISRAKSDMRALDTALRSYRNDNTANPPAYDEIGLSWGLQLLWRLTTPVAYMLTKGFVTPL